MPGISTALGAWGLENENLPEIAAEAGITEAIEDQLPNRIIDPGVQIDLDSSNLGTIFGERG
ncbi:MAG: hypothetical protein AAGC82_16430 [Pseudomonadota bacterium]